MKIVSVETLSCDAAWRAYSFVKMTTDDGIVGWSEYNEGWGFGAVTTAIQSLARHCIGEDPTRIQALTSKLHLLTRPSRGGVMSGAVAAIENALLDVKAKALGVPVYQILGGDIRKRLPVYWTHCGIYRIRHPQILGTPPIRNLDDFVTLGQEVRERGFKALKTNYLPFDGEKFHEFSQGTARSPGYPELNYTPEMLTGLADQLAALRQGAGPDMGILLDLNFNFRTEGFIRAAKAIEAAKLFWLEIDLYNPKLLAQVRRESPAPIASGEHLYGRADFRPYFEEGAMDVAIIDIMWNGCAEAMKIASMAETYEVNVATHNLYGPLGDLMAAHMLAATPNIRIMEIDMDTMPWQHDLLTEKTVVEDGHFILSDRPGWGADINEETLRAHPVVANYRK